jgi:hypothetical protein
LAILYAKIIFHAMNSYFTLCQWFSLQVQVCYVVSLPDVVSLPYVVSLRDVVSLPDVISLPDVVSLPDVPELSLYRSEEKILFTHSGTGLTDTLLINSNIQQGRSEMKFTSFMYKASSLLLIYYF